MGDGYFMTYAKFSGKLTFLTPDMHMYVCVSGGKKCYVFVKVCVRTKWMTPVYIDLCTFLNINFFCPSIMICPKRCLQITLNDK